MDRYRYYRSILSVMLATDSIDLWVKNFSFLTDSIDHRSEKKNFSSKKSNHRLKIFFLLKIIDLIDVFFTVNRLSVSIQSMFFSPSVPIYASHPLTLWISQPFLVHCLMLFGCSPSFMDHQHKILNFSFQFDLFEEEEIFTSY
jgi:hypothetical protein